MRDTCWPAALTDARIDPGQLRGYQEWAVGHGLLDRVLADELLDDRFVEAATARLAR